MTPQEQEALSIRYGERIAIVVPLKDGSFGVFACDHTLESLLIVSNPDELILAITSRANMVKRKTPSKLVRSSVSTEGLFDDDE